MRKLEDFVPAGHPLREIRKTANAALAQLGPTLTAMYAAEVKGESFPTRYEPGAGLVIPMRNEPGRGLEAAVGRLMGSLPARRVDHRIDGDRHERSAGAYLGADAAGAGRSPCYLRPFCQ